MGIMKEMFGMTEGKGVDCVANQDGTQTCTVFEKKGNDLTATGTTFTAATDPNSCDAVLVGHNRILNEDEELVGKKLKQISGGCRRGIA